MSEISNEALTEAREEAGVAESADGDNLSDAEAVDLSGFDDSEQGDGSLEAPNNSIENTEEAEAIQQPEPVNAGGGRAEKRDRTSGGRIQQLIAERENARERAAAMQAELEEYRAMARQAEREQFLPLADEDGNYSADDILQYSANLAEAAKQEAVESVRAELAAERQQVAMEAALNQGYSIGEAVMREYPVMNPNSSEFNEQIADYVRAQAVNAVAPYVEGGQFEQIPEVMRGAINDSLAVIQAARESGIQARQAGLERLRDNSAIVGRGQGDGLGDPALDGWED